MQKRHKCTETACDKSFILPEHLRRHIQTVHGFVEHSPVKCPDCPNMYQSKDNMKRHFKQAHQTPRTLNCPHCDETFTKKRPLRIHLYSHTGDYPQKCEHCHAGFLNLKELRSHHSQKHSGNGQKSCPTCNLYFANWSAMVAHRKAAHPTTFDCSECDRKFYSRSKLKIHLVSHQRKSEWLLCCQEECSFRAQNRTKLLGHIRRNHGDKNFKCDQCELRFARLSFLHKHQRQRHKETPPTKATAERKQRKDAGQPKTSSAAKLSGLTLAPELNKVLLAGRGHQLDIHALPGGVTSCAMADSTSATDTDSELRPANYAF